MNKELVDLLPKYGGGHKVDVARLKVLLQKTSANDRSNLLTASPLCYLSNFPLHRAVHNNDIETVRYMLSDFSEPQLYDTLTKHLTMKSFGSFWGSELDRSASQCITSLHIAVYEGHKEMVEYLMKSVPTMQLKLLQWKDKDGYPVLHDAVQKKKTETVQLILNILPDRQRYNALKICIEQGETVLHFAASKGFTDIVKCVLESLPDDKSNLLKLQDCNGNTPLHKAAIEKRPETILSILQFVTPDTLKQLLNIKNRKNQTIADLAAPELYYHYSMRDLANQSTEIADLKSISAQQTKEISELREKSRGQAEAIDSQSTAVGILDERCKQQGEELTNQNAEIGDLKEKCKQQDEDMSTQKAEIKDLQETSTKQSAELTNQKAEIGDLKEKCKQQDEELTNQEGEIASLKKRCEQQEKALEETKKVMAAQGTQIDELMNVSSQLAEVNTKQAEELANHNKDIGILQGRCEQQDKALEETKKEMEAQGTQIDELIKGNCELKEENKKQAEELTKQNIEIVALKQRCNQQEKDLSTQKAEVKDLQENSTKQSEALEKADKVTAAHGNRIKELENRNNQLEKAKEQLAAELHDQISGLKRKCKRQSNELANLGDNVVTLREARAYHSQELKEMADQLGQMQTYVTTPFCTDATGDQELEELEG